MAEMTPQERASSAVARFGVVPVVAACVEVLDTDAPLDGELTQVVVDPREARALAKRITPRADQSYWWPTWALRTLLHLDPGSLDGVAESAVVSALGYWHWRPREMAAKVVVAHEIGSAADVLAGLVTTDPTPRVRVSALRGLGVVGEHEHLDAVEAARDDPEPTVVAQAERSLAQLGRRLDLPEY